MTQSQPGRHLQRKYFRLILRHLRTFPLRRLTSVTAGLVLARLLRSAIRQPCSALVDVHALASVCVQLKAELAVDHRLAPEGSVRVHASLVAGAWISRFALIDVLKIKAKIIFAVLALSKFETL